MERRAKDGTFYKSVGKDEWEPITRKAKDGTVYKKVGKDEWSPLNAKESKSYFDFSAKGLGESVKEQLPAIGGVIGGAAGFLSPLPGGAAIGAGLGAAGGKSLQGIVGKSPKTRKELYGGLLESGVSGAAAEMGGRVLGPAIKAAAKPLGKAVKTLAATASKTNKKAMDIYLARGKKVDEIIKKFDNIDDAPVEFRKELMSELRGAQRDASQAMGKILNDPKYSQRLQVKVKPIRDLLLEQQSKINKVTNPADYNQIEEIIGRVDQLSPTGKMSVTDLHNVKKMLYEMSKGTFQKAGEITRSGSFGQSVARQAAGKVRNMINSSAPELKELNSKLAKLHEFEDKMPKSLLDPSMTASRMSSVARGAAPELAREIESMGPQIGRPGLLEDIEDIYAATQFAKADPISGSFTGRSLLAPGIGYGMGGPV